MAYVSMTWSWVSRPNWL